MSRSKQSTPVANEAHPAYNLQYLDEDIKNQLLKTPFKLALETETYETQLKELRNDWRYAYVLQWLYYFRGAIKLSGEPFSVDLIEEELVGLTENSLINKISTNLAALLIGTKVSPQDFSFKVRYLFGEQVTALGTEEEPKEFDSLSLLDKFDVLYSLIFQVQYTEAFKKQVEKYEHENELRFEPIFENGEESYFLLSDNRIYHRVIKNYPKLNIPKKFKYSKNYNPEVELQDIEPEFEWKLVAMGIYQIHDFLISIKSNKLLKPLFQNIKDHINDLATEDLTTRKKVVKRKREQQLHELVNHRKRSSRLQEKDEQERLERIKREEELERQRLENEKLKTQRNLKKKVNALKREIEDRLRTQTSSRRGVIDLSDKIPSNLAEVELEEGDWYFDCHCGVNGKNYDDGVKLITCERCNRWQHLKCQERSVQQELVRNSNDVFICNWCKQDLEQEVVKKLEEEKLQRQLELEERAREKELQKQRAEEKRLQLEEEERQRKEELERERERRILEREKLKERSNSPAVHTPIFPEPTVKSSEAPSGQSNGPVMGVFQTTYQQQPGLPPQPIVQQHQLQQQPQHQPQHQPQPIFYQQQHVIPQQQHVVQQQQYPQSQPQQFQFQQVAPNGAAHQYNGTNGGQPAQHFQTAQPSHPVQPPHPTQPTQQPTQPPHPTQPTQQPTQPTQPQQNINNSQNIEGSQEKNTAFSIQNLLQ